MMNALFKVITAHTNIACLHVHYIVQKQYLMVSQFTCACPHIEIDERLSETEWIEA